MTELRIEGDKGYGPFSVGGQDFYDARGATVRVNNDPNFSGGQTGWRINSSPANAVWLGGEVTSDNRVSEQEWTRVHSKDGPGMLARASNNLTIRGLKMTATFDGINVSDGKGVQTIDTCWLTRVIDDQVEADQRPPVLRLMNSYIEEGSGQNISSRPGSGFVGTPPRMRQEIIGNLIEGRPLFLDTREKNTFPWTEALQQFFGLRPGIVHGIPWKPEADGIYDDVLIRDNIFRLWGLFNAPTSVHAIVRAGWTVLEGSGNNILIWKGPQTRDGNGGVDVVEVPKIGGGTLMLPASLLGSGTNRTRTLSLFRFTDEDGLWLDAVDRWRNVTFPAALGQVEEPPPPPPPPPEDPCAVERAEIARLTGERDAAVAVAERYRMALQDIGQIVEDVL